MSRRTSNFSKRNFTVSGQKFPTIKDAVHSLAPHLRENMRKVYNRLHNHGWSAEEALELRARPEPKRPKPHFKQPQKRWEIIVQGKRFPTKKAAIETLAPHLLANRTKVELRITRYGWTPEEALELVERPSRKITRPGNWKKSIETKEGRNVPHGAIGDFSLYQIENTTNQKIYIGITIGKIRDRFHSHFYAAQRGEPGRLYDAMRKYNRNNFEVSLIRNDARNWLELERQEIATIKSLKTTDVRFGYNIAPGGDLGTSKTFEVDGLQFLSYASAADYFGIDAKVFVNRLIKGWSKEEACGLTRRPNPNNPIPTTFSGKKYISQDALART